MFMDKAYHLCLLVVIFFNLLNFALSTAKAENCETYTKESDVDWYNESEYAKDVNYKQINKTKLGDTKFINSKINGRNVLEIPISANISNDLFEYYETYVEPFISDEDCNGRLDGVSGHEVFCMPPKGWKSDIKWFSVDSISSYEHLIHFFDAMRLRDIFTSIIDVDHNIIVYSMFFVRRSEIPRHYWHVDFMNTTNTNGFTLLTPLQKRNKIKLAYKDLNGDIQHYKYKKNVGIVFGENFRHATDITRRVEDVEVLFCFTFGTDKMRDWSIIKTTVASQGSHYMHPRNGFIIE